MLKMLLKIFNFTAIISNPY